LGSGGAATAAAAGAAAGEAVFPKRQRLVRVDDPVKLQAIRLLAVLGECCTSSVGCQGCTSDCLQTACHLCCSSQAGRCASPSSQLHER
jgi:hypothetical protein